MDFKGFLGLLPFFLSTTLALICALTYKLAHYRRARRSPLADRQVGHVPGQHLVKRMSDHESEMLLSVMLMYLAFPLMFMAWIGIRIDLTDLDWGGTEWIFLTAALLLFGYGMWGYIRHLHARDNIRDGLLAERVTGMHLNRLVAHGCLVLHDLPCEGFNIDHVVIAPRGVYAVETKSFRKPKDKPANVQAKVTLDNGKLVFEDFITSKPVDQSRRQAQWLARYLRETLKEPIVVNPAIALPGWYVEKTRGNTSDVFAFTPMGRGYEWFTYGEEALSPAKRSVIAQALATRYPTVA